MKDVSYALGMTMANNLKRSEFKNIDIEEFARGLKDAFNGSKLEMDPQKAYELLNAYQTKVQNEAFEKNKKAGDEYLAKNKLRPEVTTTASGLQYEILKEGNGAKPKASSTVRCHYEGKLLNGQIFDSSYKRNEPADFPVGGVIPGWVEALQLMPVGSKWRLHIPSDLAYGPQQVGELIEPNSTLIFDVELLEIVG